MPINYDELQEITNRHFSKPIADTLLLSIPMEDGINTLKKDFKTVYNALRFVLINDKELYDFLDHQIPRREFFVLANTWKDCDVEEVIKNAKIQLAFYKLIKPWR